MFRFLRVILLLLIFPLGACRAENRLEKLTILRAGYPRAFFFRATEGFARARRLPFEEWSDTFRRLNGIMGKALDEEVPHTSTNCIPYFTRFKRMHPEQAVLLHFNGNARDPRFDAGEFFAGHWLYYNGCLITKDLPAEEGESIIHVEDTSLFRTQMGRYGDKNEDLGICAIGSDGKPDWSVSEQVELLDINHEQRTLRVKRGAFGTKPLAFKARKAYIAAHVTEGPWGKRSNLLWFYNYSTACPRDSKGRTCADVLVEDLAKRFLKGGELECFDGLEFDVSHFGRMKVRAARRDWDVNADGKPDGGIIDGINTYGIGVFRFHQKLRERLGDDFLILADGGSPSSQRSFGILNGIESEGFPTLKDYRLDEWSSGLNRHFYWRDNARKPALNYVNHKFVEPVRGIKGKVRRVETPFSISRLIFAACMFTDSAITYSLSCPAEEGERYGIYDELRMGTEGKINYLGKPLGAPIRMALRSPDLLNGAGRKPTPAFLKKFESDDAEIALSPSRQAVKIRGKNDSNAEMSWRLVGIEVPSGDVFVHFTVRVEPMRGYPSAIARLLTVGLRREGELMTPRPPVTGMALRGKKEEPINPETRAIVRDLREIEIEGETRLGYFVHPPYVGGCGYVFWQTDATVPERKPILQFYTGLRRARSKSDGITYRVVLIADGKEHEIFSNHQASYGWEAHTASLNPWRGKTVTLKFIADCGSADNTIADHGAWAEVLIRSEGEQWRPVAHKPYMTWAGGKEFDAGFYWR
ncbi:MAG: hypothetical protein DRP79_10135, partial [Planctomycetota bacterium]